MKNEGDSDEISAKSKLFTQILAVFIFTQGHGTYNQKVQPELR